ncbi:MAG: site-2 protease family protein [Verrucomicrobia bacterium]|nr:site-2 protease family protein [Verrucomicrobiota bacterium]
MFSLLYLILAAFALGFLIFIHELGHYWIARREGMTVEAFSIGFGKPIYVWEHKGVKWQFCWLPFGGYVRIAGMEKKGSLEPYQIPDGFYGKKPWSRIKVALMGPIVNIVFAFVAFSIIWIGGGRLKSFSDYTHILGGVDSGSPLYSAGIREGDEISKVNGKPFKGFQDFLYAVMFDESNLQMDGQEVDYYAQTKKPYSYTFKFNSNEEAVERASSVMSMMTPADYLVYDPLPNRTTNPMPPDSPMKDSGIEYGDRIVWVDGELIFSLRQLVATINEPKTLATVQRGNETFIARIPRVRVSDLRINPQQKAELDDWQHEASIQGKLSELHYIPYNLTTDNIVEGPISYLNDRSEEQLPSGGGFRNSPQVQLQAGDKILAIDGMPVKFSYELLNQVQTRCIQLIVNREGLAPPVNWKDADKAFVNNVDWAALSRMVSAIGTDQVVKESGKLKLLNPATPKPWGSFSLPDDVNARFANQFLAQKKEIEKIDNPQERERALQILEENRNKLMLGISLINRQVAYNPTPVAQFSDVVNEVYRTMSALVTGYVSPKWMAGPVGIVQVMHHGWMISFKEALFWMGMISLNLGILNLLPIPVLDGGHICFSLWEAITKKPIKAKTMERLILPFVVLLIAFFIYLTYHDLMRLFGRFF